MSMLLGFAVEWEPDPDNVYLTSGCDNLALHRALRGRNATRCLGAAGESRPSIISG